jgi:hypothetical protein
MDKNDRYNNTPVTSTFKAPSKRRLAVKDEMT